MLSQLELLAEVDALTAELLAWADRAPDWPAARQCQALMRRLAQRSNSMRIRLDAPLVVATLGGTGTGKSSLVNALVGSEVTTAGHLRPTTRKPVLICHPRITPEQLEIDRDKVELVERDLPALTDLVLLDCPDPDSAEDATPGSNLAMLRDLLPHCDVLLVTATQQKYDSARVAQELVAAAPGTRLVFVQTHADSDEDIRDDWRRVLTADFAAGQMFFVDSLSALADARAGIQPRGEFGRLVDFLTRELAGAAAKRIRRANFLDLVENTLTTCREQVDAAMPAIEQLEAGLTAQRQRLAQRLSGQMRSELLTSRRPWENRLLGEVASAWGFSPFSCLLRMYQGLGGLLSGAALWRARNPAQMALWGVWEAGRRWHAGRQTRQADNAASRAVTFSWEETELRTAAMIVEGYAAEACLKRDETQLAVVEREAAQAGANFVRQAAADVQTLLGRLARRHTGWFTRWRYEILLLAMLGLLLYRFGKNFFYDSWLAVEFGLANQPHPPLGTDFLVSAAVVLLAWCGLLLWMFTSRLRRGLSAAIDELADGWNSPRVAASLFANLESQCRQIKHFREDLERLQATTASLQNRLAEPEPKLGHRIV